MTVDYRRRLYDVITNPRWRTVANKKIVMSAYVGHSRSLKLVTLDSLPTFPIVTLSLKGTVFDI